MRSAIIKYLSVRIIITRHHMQDLYEKEIKKNKQPENKVNFQKVKLIMRM